MKRRRYADNAGASRSIEMIDVCLAIIVGSWSAAIALSAVTSGLDSVRLSSASDSIVSFLNAGSESGRAQPNAG